MTGPAGTSFVELFSRVPTVEVRILFGLLSLGWGLREGAPSLEARADSRAFFRLRIFCNCWWASSGSSETSMAGQMEDPFRRPMYCKKESIN